MLLQGSHRLILSGTPVENKLEDLWSLINFVQPGLLGPLQYFVKEYCQRIMKGSDSKADDVDKIAASKMTVEIHRRLKNHILRRTKLGLQNQINMPTRNEFIVRCRLTEQQLQIYAAYLSDAMKFLSRGRRSYTQLVYKKTPSPHEE